jgi:hypothetical protein
MRVRSLLHRAISREVVRNPSALALRVFWLLTIGFVLELLQLFSLP